MLSGGILEDSSSPVQFREAVTQAELWTPPDIRHDVLSGGILTGCGFQVLRGQSFAVLSLESTARL